MKASLTYLPVVLFLAFWELSAQNFSHLKFITSSPFEIIIAAREIFFKQEIWVDLFYTSICVLIGLVLGTIIGVGLGVLSSLSPALSRVSRSYFLFLGSIPVFSLCPIIIFCFGAGLSGKIFLAALATTISSFQLSLAGATEALKQYQTFLVTVEAKSSSKVHKVLLPASLLWVLEGYKSSVATAILGVFVGEWMSADVGIGHFITKATGLYKIADVWCGIFLLCGLSLMLITFGTKLIGVVSPGHGRILVRR